MAKYEGVVRDSKGVTLAAASVTVYDGGTSSLSSIFSDRALTAALANPFTADDDGSYEFYVEAGEYKVKVTKDGFSDYEEDNITIGLSDEYWVLDSDSSGNLEIKDRSTGNAVVKIADGAAADTFFVAGSGNIGINTETEFGSGQGVIGIKDAASVPSANPSGGGILYSDSGVGKWRRSDGTIDTLGSSVVDDSLGLYYNTYHPDRPPTASEVESSQTDEFDGNSSAVWAWGDQGTSTVTEEWDVLKLQLPAETGDQMRGYFVEDPGAVNFRIFAKVSPFLSAENMVGIALLSGTLATPTEIVPLGIYRNASTDIQLRNCSVANYTASPTWTSKVICDGSFNQPSLYISIKYTSSTKVAGFTISYDGFVFNDAAQGTKTLSNHPDFIGIIGDSENASTGASGFYHFFRVFTSSSGFTDGQTGRDLTL